MLAAAWPIGLIAGRLASRIVRRIPGSPDFLPDLVARSVRSLVFIVGLPLSLSLVGVDVGWFTVVVLLVAVIAILMLRPLIENLAAGLLLQSRPAFNIGDEIESNGFVGDVDLITVRSTVLRTRDGRRVHIPNQDVLDNAVVVYTSLEKRRSSIDLEIEYGADIDEASRCLVSAAMSLEGVEEEPSPSVRARSFGSGTYVLSLRWWHEPDLSSGSRTLDGVVRAVKRELDDAGIRMPSPESIIRQPDLG